MSFAQFYTLCCTGQEGAAASLPATTPPASDVEDGNLFQFSIKANGTLIYGADPDENGENSESHIGVHLGEEELFTEPKTPSRPPHRMTVLRTMTDETILCVGCEYDTKADLLLSLSELCEKNGNKYVTNGEAAGIKLRNEKRRVIVGCAGGCDFLMKARLFRSSTGYQGWKVTDLHACTCTLLFVGGNRKASTNYSVEAMAAVVLSQLSENPKTSGGEIKNIIQECTRIEPSISFAYRVKTRAMQMLYGDPIETLPELPALIALLNEDGHQAELLTGTAADARKLLLERERTEHEYSNSEAPFDEATVRGARIFAAMHLSIHMWLDPPFGPVRRHRGVSPPSLMVNPLDPWEIWLVRGASCLHPSGVTGQDNQGYRYFKFADARRQRIAS